VFTDIVTYNVGFEKDLPFVSLTAANSDFSGLIIIKFGESAAPFECPTFADNVEFQVRKNFFTEKRRAVYIIPGVRCVSAIFDIQLGEGR